MFKNVTIVGNTVSVVVSGLKVGTAYDVRVAMVTKAGATPYSESIYESTISYEGIIYCHIHETNILRICVTVHDV